VYVLHYLPYSVARSDICIADPLFLVHSKAGHTKLIYIHTYINIYIQRRRIEAAEMKLLRPLAGYTHYDHKTNNSIRKELRITSILDKIDE